MYVLHLSVPYIFVLKRGAVHEEAPRWIKLPVGNMKDVAVVRHFPGKVKRGLVVGKARVLKGATPAVYEVL